MDLPLYFQIRLGHWEGVILEMLYGVFRVLSPSPLQFTTITSRLLTSKQTKHENIHILFSTHICQKVQCFIFSMQDIFIESTHWANSIQQSNSLSVCASVCLFVCLFVPFSHVFFQAYFAPTSRSRMSKVFRDSGSFGKSAGNKWSQN